MKKQSPEFLKLAAADVEFLTQAARRILEGAEVAGTTAEACKARGIDVAQLDRLIPGFGTALRIDGHVFKKVEPDPETPGNFGLFVRVTKNADKTDPAGSA
jgi:hypothetical protein